MSEIYFRLRLLNIYIHIRIVAESGNIDSIVRRDNGQQTMHIGGTDIYVISDHET